MVADRFVTQAMVTALSCVLASCCTSMVARHSHTGREHLDEKLREARRLAAQKPHEALQAYLYVFDNSRSVPAYGGTRLSYILRDIAKLGQHHKAALAALRERRDRNEHLILEGGADPDVYDELWALNSYLNEKHRTMVLYDKLQSLTPRPKHAIRDLQVVLCDDFLRSKRYADFAAGDFCMWQTASRLASVAVAKDFVPGEQPLARSVRERAIRAYEAFLLLRRADPALKLKQWLLRLELSTTTYVELITAAQRAKRADVVRSLAEEAHKSLAGSDLTAIDELTKKIE